MPDGEAIEAGIVTRSIEGAQRKVEARNFDVRKQLLEYDDVANDQRKVIYQQRNDILEAPTPARADRRACARARWKTSSAPSCRPKASRSSGTWPAWRRCCARNGSVDAAAGRRGREERRRSPTRTSSSRSRRRPTTLFDGKVDRVGLEQFTPFMRMILLQSIDSALARAPGRARLPAPGHPPARLRAEEPEAGIQARGVRAVLAAARRRQDGRDARADDACASSREEEVRAAPPRRSRSAPSTSATSPTPTRTTTAACRRSPSTATALAPGRGGGRGGRGGVESALGRVAAGMATQFASDVPKVGRNDPCPLRQRQEVQAVPREAGVGRPPPRRPRGRARGAQGPHRRRLRRPAPRQLPRQGPQRRAATPTCYRVIRSGEVRVNRAAPPPTRGWRSATRCGSRRCASPIAASGRKRPAREFPVVHEDEAPDLRSTSRPASPSTAAAARLRRHRADAAGPRPGAASSSWCTGSTRTPRACCCVAKTRPALVALQNDLRSRTAERALSARPMRRSSPAPAARNAQGDRRRPAQGHSHADGSRRVRAVDRRRRAWPALDQPRARRRAASRDPSACSTSRSKTGRTHQIRVHLARRRPRHRRRSEATATSRSTERSRVARWSPPLRFERMFLHARRLSFAHPASGEPVVLESGSARGLHPRLLQALGPLAGTGDDAPVRSDRVRLGTAPVRSRPG